MKNFDDDKRWEKFSFTQINKLKQIPDELLDEVLNLNESFSAQDIKEFKDYILEELREDKGDDIIYNKHFVKQLVTLFNSKKGDSFFQQVISFGKTCPDASSAFKRDVIINLIAAKFKKGEEALLSKIDYSKLTYSNLANFESPMSWKMMSIKNIDIFYDIKVPHEETSIYQLLELYPETNINPLLKTICNKLITDESIRYLEKFIEFSNDNLDISCLNNSSIEEIKKIFKSYPELRLACKEKNLDSDYIIKKYPGSTSKIYNILKNNINIEDIYKNGYDETFFNCILDLRKNNLKQYEGNLLEFNKINCIDRKMKMYTAFLRAAKPDNTLLKAFEKHLQEEDINKSEDVINVFASFHNLNCPLENPMVLLEIPDKIEKIVEFCRYHDISDITKFDLKNCSEEFLDRALYAFKKGFAINDIFAPENSKYDDMIYEALYLKEENIEVPDDFCKLYDKFVEVSNKDYETVYKMYLHNAIKIDRNLARKLEILINYNKTHKPISIEEELDCHLTTIEKDFCEIPH